MKDPEKKDTRSEDLNKIELKVKLKIWKSGGRHTQAVSFSWPLPWQDGRIGDETLWEIKFEL